MLKLPAVITAHWLRGTKACANQIHCVANKWPNGIKPTRAAALKAARLRLDVSWLAALTLDAPQLRSFSEDVADAAALAFLKQWKIILKERVNSRDH